MDNTNKTILACCSGCHSRQPHRPKTRRGVLCSPGVDRPGVAIVLRCRSAVAAALRAACTAPVVRWCVHHSCWPHQKPVQRYQAPS